MINSHHQHTLSTLRLTCIRWLCLLVALINTPLVMAAEDYLLGGGDTVNITVYEQPDLATAARISQDDGTITFPLLGEVRLAGLSPEAAAQKIEKLLKEGGFVKAPEVSVTVKDFFSQKIPVLGQVNNPGEYALQGEKRVVDLISEAGGLKPNAADKVFVVKNEGGKSVKYEIDILRFYAGDMTQNIKVASGDYILVPKMDAFYIYGEVQRPGTYRLERDMTLMQALSVAGGVNERGSLKRIVATRRQANGETKKIKVGLTDVLQPNDVVYVKERLF